MTSTQLAYILGITITILFFTLPALATVLLVIALILLIIKDRSQFFISKPVDYSLSVSIDLAKLRAFISMKSDYLRQPIWNSKRLAVLRRDDYTCQSCGDSGVVLHVHHTRDYCLIPNEPTSSLVALCATCHTYQHTLYGYPQTYEDYMNWNAPLKSMPKDLQ